MNDFTVGLAASPWIVAIVIVAAFALAFLTYRRTLPPVPPLRRWTLILLRTIGIGLLLFVLFEPVMSFLEISAEEPSVIVAVDNSESMTMAGQDSARIAEARGIVRRVQESELGENTDVLLFSDTALGLAPPIPYNRLDASGSETRIEALFTLVADSLKKRNVRAVVLLSDGRYNAGANPLFEAEKLGVPVFAVGLGDSTEPRDLSVQQIFTNEIAYVGSELPVEVRVKSAGFESGMATVTLRDDNGVVSTQQIPLAPGTNEYTANFVYKPKSEGTARLRADIAGTGGELTPKNNSRSVFIRVKSNKRRIVLIAGGPNPDVAFLRRVLSEDRNTQLVTFIQKSGTEFLEGKLDASAFRDAEGVILVGYPTVESSPDVINTVRSIVQNGNLPLFLIMSARTDINKLRALESLLPVTFGPPRNNEMTVLPELTEAGRNSPVMRVGAPEAWSSLPPIFRSETSVRARPEAEVLAQIRIGTAKLDEPLIVSRKLGRSRSLAVLGYGIFRWQLVTEGLRETRGESETGLLGDFVASSLRWLATRDEERRVRITTSKQLYNLGESVRVLAQVYDDSYEPLSDAAVTVNVQGAERSYDLTLAPAGSGRYEGTLANLPSGDYRFNGRATHNGREIGSDGGRFVVGEIGLEFLQPSMNAELMRALAARTGGAFYTARGTTSLIEDILAHKGFAPRSLEAQRDFALWNYPWLLAAALLAFALEWIIRKRSGML